MIFLSHSLNGSVLVIISTILRYVFEVSNRLGSIQGCVALVVHEGEGEDGMNLTQNFESNLVTQPEFGEYVASLHSCNNSTFVLQYKVLLSQYTNFTNCKLMGIYSH